MSERSEDGAPPDALRTTDKEGQASAAEGDVHGERLGDDEPRTRPIGVDASDVGADVQHRRQGGAAAGEAEDGDLDDTDVLGGKKDAMADTDVLGGKKDAMADTDVLGALDEEGPTDELATAEQDAVQERSTAPSRAAGSDRDFDDIQLQVSVDDATDPVQPVMTRTRSEADASSADREALEELRRVLADPMAAESDGKDATLEIDSVYARSLLRRTSEEAASDEAVAELVDPFELTGFRIGEHGSDSSSALADSSASTDRFEQPPQTDRAPQPRRRDWSASVSVGLDAVAQTLVLEAPWAQWVEELRQETLAERDRRLRSSYLYLISGVLRLHGGIGVEMAGRLEEAAARTRWPVRTILLRVLLKHWDDADERFFELVERLEAFDDRYESETAGMRRASLVVERLLAGGLDTDVEQRLEHWISPPETVPGLTLRAIRAHQQRLRTRAGQVWRQVSRHLREDPRAVVVDAAAYFLRGTPGFFDYLRRRIDNGNPSRTLLLMMQREAAATGDHLREATALRHLVAADVALGRRLDATSASRRNRLKAIAAARFYRLATLLEGLGDARRADATLQSLQPHNVVRDAVALAPRHPLYLRRLARWSRAQGDLTNCARSLGSLAVACADPRLGAHFFAELARTISVAGGQQELVEQYLDEALERDPGCTSARLERARRRIIAGEDPAAYADASIEADALVFEFDAEQRQLIAAQRWQQLGELLERELESAVEPHTWAQLTYRLAQLHGWHHPRDDDRLRAEFLEQVLIATPEHQPTLVELLDLRLANREFIKAADILEQLVELTKEPVDRASWLAELAGLVEHNLGTPDRAFEAFERAVALDPDNIDAFYGLLRTDMASSASAVGGIVDRLDAGVAVREARELAFELILRADEVDAARAALDERFPDEPFWHFVRLCLDLERGEYSRPSVDALQRMWVHPSAEPMLGVFERLICADEPTGVEQLLRRLNAIKVSPIGEGRLVRAMFEASRLGEPEVEGMLAAIRSRRTDDALTRATELVAMAASLLYRGQNEQALRVCEHLLERFPDFLPALKMAKLCSESLDEWGQLVQWCEREAERTEVSQVAFENRLVASEIQRKYLGDFEAACEQFRTVLAKDPGHQEAFDKLKPLLLQRGEVDQLLELYEQRLEQTGSSQDRCEMLNEMADISLHRGKDQRAAIGYFERALKLDADQLRSLRILAELYYEMGASEQSLECYRRAVELTENEMLLERLWIQMGRQCEEIGRAGEALRSYEMALRVSPSRADIILDVARLEAEAGDLQAALIHLHRLESTASNPEVLRAGRAAKARYLAEMGRPDEQVLAAYRELLLHHPDDLDAVDAVCEYVGQGADDPVVDRFFGKLAHQALEEMQGRPFEPHFAIAQRLGHSDRAFCLAAVAKTLGYATREMDHYYEQLAVRRRWPQRAVPPSQSAKMLPGALLSAFVELLRHSEPALRRAIVGDDVDARAERGARLDSPLEPALELAARWPSLFGFELADITQVEQLDGASRILIGPPGVRVVVDPSWRSVSDPTELLVGLGLQLAAHTLGVGAWMRLETTTRFIAFSRLVGHFASGWGGAAASRPVDGIDWSVVEQWLERDAGQELATKIVELSGRLSPQAVEPQFRLVELGVERLGCVVLDDPHRFMPHTRFFGSEHGMLQQPWSYMLSPTVAEIRRGIGVAMPDQG